MQLTAHLTVEDDTMIRIIIADDHPIVREGLKQILAGAHDMEVVAEADSGYDLLDKLPKFLPDTILLDIKMPGLGGLDVLKQIKALKPELPVLILSMHPEEQYAIRVLKAGASGYLTKNSAPEKLIDAIRKVNQGGKYISASLAERLAFDLDSDSHKSSHEFLSDREYQVLCMIAQGKTVSEIAETLKLSVKTISTYRARILEKMKMKNNAEMTYYAIQNGLVE